MFIDQSIPRELYQERLRMAEEARLAHRVRLQRSQYDRHGSLRHTVGDLLVEAGLRLRGELPLTGQPTTRRAA